MPSNDNGQSAGLIILGAVAWSVCIGLFIANWTENDGDKSSPEVTIPVNEDVVEVTPTPLEVTTSVPEEFVLPDYGLRAEMLGELPQEECVTVDHYEFLGFPDDPRVREDGAFFNYDCETDHWGWYFQGAESDKWTATPIDPNLVNIPEGELSIELPIELLGVPANLVHPTYPEALSLADLETGMEVCVHNAFGEALVTDTIESISAHVYMSGDEINAWPAYNRVSDDPIMELESMQDVGLVPFENGLWSTQHVTAGAC